MDTISRATSTTVLYFKLQCVRSLIVESQTSNTNALALAQALAFGPILQPKASVFDINIFNAGLLKWEYFYSMILTLLFSKQAAFFLHHCICTSCCTTKNTFLTVLRSKEETNNP